jgi:hypothetical protein
VNIHTPPHKAAAGWQQRNMYVIKRHNGTRMDVLAEMEFGMDSYVVDEFPHWRCCRPARDRGVPP